MAFFGTSSGPSSLDVRRARLQSLFAEARAEAQKDLLDRATRTTLERAQRPVSGTLLTRAAVDDEERRVRRTSSILGASL